MNSLIINALIYLLAAVVVVPLAKQFKLGSIVGYILAGILIGPFVLGLISDQKEVHTFAEFGIIMMLFLIGLEIRPSELWSMRRKFLRYGVSQILLTTLVIGLVVYYFTAQINLSIIAGLVLALSSTAIVIPSLSEMGQDANNTGRSALSVLLLQDVMVIPIIALIALLSPSGMEYQNGELIQQFNNIERFIIIVASVGLIVFVIRIIGYRFFHYIAKTNQREIFIASILLIVIAVSYIMQLIGLSPALGAFLVGMLLSDNEYRHSIEVDIAPFKDILLGLFFITVGTSLNVTYALDHYTLALAAFVALLIIKGAILWAIAYQGDIEPQQRLFFAVSLCQAGEFAFVLGGFAFQAQLFDYNFYTLINVIATLSMISTPFLMRAFLKRQGKILNDAEELDPGEVQESEIIIAGFGRFGQIVGRFLLSQGYRLTILEEDPDQVRLLRDFGYQVYYGRASDERILETIKVNKAKYFIVAVDDHKASLEIIDLLNKKYPRLKVLARAMDRRHVYDLMDRKVFSLQRETFLSSLAIGEDILTHMGVTKNSIKKKLKLFTDHDNSTIKMMKRQFDNNENYSLTFKQRQEDLKNLLTKEENQMKKKKNPKPKPKKTSWSMKKLLLIFFILGNCAVASEMKLIGQGTLKVLFFEVYDIRLLADSKPFSWKNKFQLEFEYKREVKKETVIESSIKEMRRQSSFLDKDINKWQEYLEISIKPVQEGSQATVTWNPNGQITFHYQSSEPTTIEDENFARAFLNIWLGEETSQPKLRNQLLGDQR